MNDTFAPVGVMRGIYIHIEIKSLHFPGFSKFQPCERYMDAGMLSPPHSSKASTEEKEALAPFWSCLPRQAPFRFPWAKKSRGDDRPTWVVLMARVLLAVAVDWRKHPLVKIKKSSLV